MKPDAIREHAETCGACRDQGFDPTRVVETLAASSIPIDTSGLASRIRTALRPELERLSRRAWRRRVLVAVAAALVPLPLVVASEWLAIGLVRSALASLVPDAVVLWIVAGQATLLALLVSATYAAIPVVAERMTPRWRMP